MESLALALASFVLSPIGIILIIVLAMWDIGWKFFGLWKAARNNHLAWFICIGIFNTIGILPIVYILLHKEKIEK